jgi:hypothetical protein
VVSDWYGITLLVLRNGLLAAAALTAARRLWRSTVPPAVTAPFPSQATTRAKETPVSS